MMFLISQVRRWLSEFSVARRMRPSIYTLHRKGCAAVIDCAAAGIDRAMGHLRARRSYLPAHFRYRAPWLQKRRPRPVATLPMALTRKTTILVVGEQDLRLTKGQERSSKQQKAEAMIEAGAAIRIVGERDFMLMVGSAG
jgi:hypothetical protein